MGSIVSEMGGWLFAIALMVTFFAGFIKGAVGFAMPMIMISGLSTFLSAELALALLIVPTLITNGVQALRQGVKAAWQSIKRFRVYMGIGLICLLASAQLYAVLSETTLYLVIGLPIFLFSVLQLSGWRLRLKESQQSRAEILIGAFAGFCGGISGVWGPPTVAYLTAVNTPKVEQMRTQGVIYGLGAVALLGAHIKSGVVSAQTLPLSCLMVIPAAFGMYVGMQVQDRMDAEKFRAVTLIVLLVASLNLIRKSVLG